MATAVVRWLVSLFDSLDWVLGDPLWPHRWAIAADMPPSAHHRGENKHIQYSTLSRGAGIFRHFNVFRDEYRTSEDYSGFPLIYTMVIEKDKTHFRSIFGKIALNHHNYGFQHEVKWDLKIKDKFFEVSLTTPVCSPSLHDPSHNHGPRGFIPPNSGTLRDRERQREGSTAKKHQTIMT